MLRQKFVAEPQQCSMMYLVYFSISFSHFILFYQIHTSIFVLLFEDEKKSDDGNIENERRNYDIPIVSGVCATSLMFCETFQREENIFLRRPQRQENIFKTIKWENWLARFPPTYIQRLVFNLCIHDVYFITMTFAAASGNGAVVVVERVQILSERARARVHAFHNFYR